MARPSSPGNISTRLASTGLTMLVLLLLLIFAVVTWQRTDELFADVSASTPARSKNGASKAAPLVWERWENCTLLADRNNDGDSFRVAYAHGKATVRLYFVDCPEKDVRRDNAARLHEQARYFQRDAWDAPREMAAIGKAAGETAKSWLEAAPFTVVTCRERVYDSDRIYAHVFLAPQDGSTSTDGFMAWELVSRGLARIHTKGEQVPSRGDRRHVTQELRELEAKAKKSKLGAWQR